MLVDALAENVPLHFVGAVSARDDTTRIARTHLRVHAALEAVPEIDQAPLLPAVFLIGWPRTGSTFLHQLLACDPDSRTMPYWESFDPVPPPPGEPDRRAARLRQTLRLLERIEPRYHAIHPMTAESTEECVALFMNDFRTMQFDFQYRVPEYNRWLLDQDANVAYAQYERQLRLVQHHRPAGRRQVLKDPTHLIHLETLIARFPDARFVFLHRDPVISLSSICSLTAYTRALFTDDVDARSIGPEVLAGHWPRALEESHALRERLPEAQRIDVRHPDLVRDPIAVVRAIYDRFGMEWTDAARGAMGRFLEERDAGARRTPRPRAGGLWCGSGRRPRALRGLLHDVRSLDRSVGGDTHGATLNRVGGPLRSSGQSSRKARSVYISAMLSPWPTSAPR